ncbi:hypothetical protein DVH24_028275 [Malus domestica]|uniref:Secreted protein n=1 Tax=Malus domestica TaxID=3750 RepID=A0A498H9K0_MALDO|nr:hypothetical protein DVH24_028275 [Malus domestica]
MTVWTLLTSSLLGVSLGGKSSRELLPPPPSLRLATRPQVPHRSSRPPAHFLTARGFSKQYPREWFIPDYSRVILSSTTRAYATMFVAKSIVLLIALHGLPLLQVRHVTGLRNLRTSSQIYCLTKLFCN